MPLKNPGPEGRRIGLTVVTVIAACSLIAALIAGGLWWSERGEADSVRSERASAAELDTAYTEFATEVMTHLMTIRQDTLKDDVDRIVGEIEGDFSEQFAPRRDSYEEVVKTTKVAAEGTVGAAAVEKADEEQAQVIMAIDQTIANPRSEEGQDRQYRIRVTVNRHDDGVLKVSGVDFIP